MDLRPLGRTGLLVSRYALGTMGFGAEWHGAGPIDERLARSLLDVALDHGVNLIDTADIYGRGAAEAMLGKLLKRRRSRVLIATKVLGEMNPGDPSSGGLSARHIVEALNASLERLRTDHVDLYMPHAWDPEVPIAESLEALHRAVTAGKVRFLGCSNFSGRQLETCLELASLRRYYRMEFDQVQYSLACRFAEEDVVAVCQARSVSMLAWSPLGGGFLSGRYAQTPRPTGRRQRPETAFPALPEARLGGLIKVLREVGRLEGQAMAQAALAWATSKPWVASAVIGARSVAQLKMDLTARPLSPKSLAFLDRASELSGKA